MEHRTLRARPFKYGDKDAIRVWLLDRKLQPKTDLILTPIGYIVEGVAAGFLVKTDARFALLENFVSNPKADKFDTAKAFYSIVDELEREAKRLGYDMVYGITKSKLLIHIAKERGWTQAEGLTLMTKELV